MDVAKRVDPDQTPHCAESTHALRRVLRPLRCN